MRLPRTHHDQFLWHARHMCRYAYAIGQLREGLDGSLDTFTVQIRREQVYVASGNHFGRGPGGVMIWSRFDPWSTSS